MFTVCENKLVMTPFLMWNRIYFGWDAAERRIYSDYGKGLQLSAYPLMRVTLVHGAWYIYICLYVSLDNKVFPLFVVHLNKHLKFISQKIYRKNTLQPSPAT